MKKVLERTVQKAGEKMGNVEKTEYEPEVVERLAKVEQGEKEMIKVCSALECVLQPNANKRMGNNMYDKINRKIDRVSPYQDFGQTLKDYGEAMDTTLPYYDLIHKLGITEKLIGQVENEQCDILSKSFYFPMKDLIDQDLKRMRQDKELAEKRRLDLEVIKSKFKKANPGTPQYDKLEADVESARSDFVQHQERLMKVIDAIHKKIFTEKSFFSELLERQIHFHEKALEYLNQSKDDFKNFQ